MTAQDWIQKLGLEEHPEGGYFKETYRSELSLQEAALPMGYKGKRTVSTATYFMLTGKDISAFHRLRSDEIWHFYSGSPLRLYVISREGKLTVQSVGFNRQGGGTFQLLVPAGYWMAAELFETEPSPEMYSLVGCTVAPGFDFLDFELGFYEVLSKQFPHHEALLNRLCVE